MGIPMAALARQIYGGRSLRVNDEFEAASDSEADDMEAVHMAKRRVQRGAEVTRQIVPSQEHDEVIEPDVTPTPIAEPVVDGVVPEVQMQGKKNQNYDRRDVRAKK